MQSFAIGDFVVPNLDPEIYTLPSKPLICKIQNISKDGEDIQIGFCEGSERISLWFKPIKGQVQKLQYACDFIMTSFFNETNRIAQSRPPRQYIYPNFFFEGKDKG